MGPDLRRAARRRPGRWSARRSGRPSRSQACCWRASPADSVVADTTSDDWEADRHALLDRSVSLAELLGRRSLVLRADLLRPWSRWITPVVEPRRFDTRFFAAALPAGQRTRDVGGEASEVAWVTPAKALQDWERGEIRLFPPTAVTLSELAACGDVDTALAGPRAGRPDHPRGPAAGGRGLADGAWPERAPARAGRPGVTRGHCRSQPRSDRRIRQQPGPVRPRAEPVADDARRDQHLADRRAGFADRHRDRPGAGRRGAPPAHLRHRRRAWPAGRRHRADPPARRSLCGRAAAGRADRRAGARGRPSPPARQRGPDRTAMSWTAPAASCASSPRPATRPTRSACRSRPTASVLTGDTVLGRGTAVISDDGSLGDYLDSLRRLRALAESTDLRQLLPGHGPLLADPAGVLDFYLAHRAERLDEVRAALAAGDRDPAAIVARVYADVDRALWRVRRVVGPGAAAIPAPTAASCRPASPGSRARGATWPACGACRCR